MAILQSKRSATLQISFNVLVAARVHNNKTFLTALLKIVFEAFQVVVAASGSLQQHFSQGITLRRKG